MPYRNVVPSIIWTLIRARRRHVVEEEFATDPQALEAIWIPPDFGPNGQKSGGGDMPMHTWRTSSGVSNR